MGKGEDCTQRCIVTTRMIPALSRAAVKTFNPFTAPACKTDRLKSAHVHTCKQYFDGPITNLLSILCILIEFPSHAHAKRGKNLNDFKFGTSIGHFPSDRVASMAVKGLMYR